jgi:hypothetical protein
MAEKGKDREQDRSLSVTKESSEKAQRYIPSVPMNIEKTHEQLPSVSKSNGDKPSKGRNDPTRDHILPPPPAPLIDNQGNML